MRTSAKSRERGKTFFSSVPDGVFNLLSSFMEQKEFGRHHGAIQSSKQCNAHWERNLRQYVHHAEPLFRVFTPKRRCAGHFS